MDRLNQIKTIINNVVGWQSRIHSVDFSSLDVDKLANRAALSNDPADVMYQAIVRHRGFDGVPEGLLYLRR